MGALGGLLILVVMAVSIAYALWLDERGGGRR